MVKLVTLIVVCLSTFSAFCQLTDKQINTFIENSTEAELIEKNTLLSLDGNFHHAGIIAERLLELDSMNSNYNYRLGIALINSTSDFTKSAKYLERAAIKTSKNYDVFSTKEKAAPIDALFHLGRSYHLRGEIDKATKSYNDFLDKAPKKSDNISLAQLKLQQCETAKELIKNPLEYEIVNLGPRINSKAADYSPVVSLDGYAIYFTTRRLRKDSTNIDIKDIETNMYKEDVYAVYKGFDDDWGSPVIMDFCKPESNEATVAVSSDQRRIYLYKDEVGNGDIFYSDFESSEFKDLKRLETEGVNTDSWEPHITVSPDGKHKYFVSDRPGGYGGRDIYRIEKMPNGEWSEPMNLGPIINTEYDEDAPFLAVDNKTLYFSSNGTKSMGGFDVFRSQMDDLGQWTEPQNLGVPLNTTGDDIYYTTTMDGFTGYLSSFREGGEGEKDIYEIKNTHLGIEDVAGLKGDIETTDGSPIPSDVAYTLKCLTCEEDYEVTLFPRLKDGSFFANLFTCETYEMRFHHEKGQTEFYRETFSTNCVDEYQEVYKHILLDVEKMEVVEPKPEEFMPLAFKHYFDYNKNALNPAEGPLKKFLDDIGQQYENGRDEFVLSIVSSASKVRTKTFKDNQILAQTRAEEFQSMLKDYFLTNNIEGVKVQIENVLVDGPEYTIRDNQNIGKYAPYQFVEVSLNGQNLESDSETIEKLKSKDKELAERTDLPGVLVSSKMILTGINEAKEASKRSVARNNPNSYNGNVENIHNDNSTSNSDDQFEEMKSNDQYHVVAGVFENKVNADEFINKLKSSGYSNATIIGKRKGMLTVIVGSFKKEAEAVDLLYKVRLNTNPEAWILKPFTL